MKKTLFCLASLAIAGTCVVPAGAATSSLTVKLAAQNGSGENGTATLTQSGSDVKVVISIPHGPAGPQPAHIHDGTCANLGGVAYPLTNVANGSSTTTVKNLTIDKLLGGKYAINVHESTSNLGKYVSCGGIVKPTAM